ncbi:MAG TPA: nucleoside monophosphate kinase [Candidatus Paceibacterota bacterium]|nr:nucleoside monophosphate kinase [Candidatus Paceibacterota bacterium]
MERVNTVLLMGRPGCGKGTQATLLSERLAWIRLSSGDRIKEIRDGNEPFSARVRAVFDKGTLLPDWLADFILEQGLLELEPYVGVITEGFARTKQQALHYADIIDWLGRDLMVINLEVSEEEAMRRMKSRSEVQDRPDSNSEEKMRERLSLFTKETLPGLEYLRGLGFVQDVDGEQTPEKIAEDIEKLLSL